MDRIRRVSDDIDDDDEDVARVMEELIALLPDDVRTELNAGSIDVHDPEFVRGLVDHLQRDPNATKVGVARTLQEVQKKLRKLVLAEDPSARVNDTVRNETKRVGRNDRCPCGSGRKYKQCCLRKKN